jgi:peroxiredoxin Q/BCP
MRRNEDGAGAVQRVARVGVGMLLVAATAGLSGCASTGQAAEMEAAAAESSRLTGLQAPDFALPNQDGKVVRLTQYRGEWVVLYFYPKNDTPGCTCQAREFTSALAHFDRMSAKVFGISPDSVESHRAFIDAFDIRVELLADTQHEVMKTYGAWVQTPFGGRVIRSTVLVDPEGKVAYHWPEVIPMGHADRVRAKVNELQAGRGT